MAVTVQQQPALSHVDRVASQLARELPDISPAVIRHEVEVALESLGDVTVTQYLPVLVSRTVREHLRRPA